MAELVAKSQVKREADHLYFVKSYDKEGNLGIWKAKMNHGGRSKKKEAKK